MKSVFLLFAFSVLSVSAQASDKYPELQREADYKTHKVVCVAHSDQVVVSTMTSQGQHSQYVRRGRMFDKDTIAWWIRSAAFEPMLMLMHIRESIPNVRLEANGLLITLSAGRSVIRDGSYSWRLVRLMESLCGPLDLSSRHEIRPSSDITSQ